MTNPEHRTLDQLQRGDSAWVAELHSQGAERRRLMDLGILPGTHITSELVSPLGDPVAYRVRGALIALRRAQARLIQITPFAPGEKPEAYPTVEAREQQ